MFTQASSGHSLSHVVYGAADMVLACGADAAALPLAGWSAAGGRNAHGERVAVVPFQSAAALGGALLGCQGAGQRASAVVAASDLPALAPALRTLAQRSAPAVVHALARSAGAAQAAWEAAGSGGSSAALLASATPQEAHDHAALALALAHASRAPVCQLLEAAALRTVEGARLARYDALAAALGSGSGASSSGAPAAPLPTEADFEAACARLAPLLGRRPAAVEYAGPEAAECVVVCLGGGAAAQVSSALAAAAAAGTPGAASVGVLRVSLLRPWPAAAIEAALPRSAASRHLLLALPEGADGSARAAQALALVQAQAQAQGQWHALPAPLQPAFEAAEAAAVVRSLLARLPAPSAAGAAAALLAASAAPPAPWLSVWSLGGSASEWGAAGSAPAALLPLLAATEDLAAAARGGDYSGARHEGTCSDGLAALTHVTLRARASAPQQQQQQQQQQRQRSLLVLTHPALLRHFDVVRAALSASAGVLLCLPPPLPAETAALGPAPDARARARYLLAQYAPPQDAAALARAGFTALPLEAIAEAAGGSGSGAAAKGFLLRAAALALFLGGAASALPALAPLLLAQAQAQAPGVAAAAASAAAPPPHVLLQLLSGLEAGLVELAPGECAVAPAAPEGSGAGALPQRALLPAGAPAAAAAPAAAHCADAAAPAAPAAWGCIGPHQWIAPGRAPAATQPPNALVRRARRAVPAPRDALALSLAFPAAYAPAASARPLASSEHATFEATVSKFQRLTPEKYDRNIFHLEIDTSGTGLTYEIGSALGVHPRNDAARVAEFLAWYGVPGDTVVALAQGEEGEGGAPARRVAFTTAHRALLQDLDLFGRVTGDFYEALAGHASDSAQARALAALGAAAGGGDAGDAAGYAARAAEAFTPADVLREFTSARPPLQALLRALPRIKPRHYSIASSMRMHPNSVHLLVVEVEWRTPGGRTAHGLASHYLAGLRCGDPVTISVLHSEMHLPESPTAPIFMAGLGTGMAPFRAFIQERVALARSGAAVGPMTLYFGARHRAQEYLYGEELEAAAAAGLLTLRLAFSRDTEKKVYIQHLMREDGAQLWGQLQGAAPADGAFYLCGPTWPEADVENAISSAFVAHGSLSPAQAAQRITDMKAAKRYVLEVY